MIILFLIFFLNQMDSAESATQTTKASRIAYATYLGGSSLDIGESIIVDPQGSVYIGGYSGSADFPTKNPIQKTPFGAFITKLSPDGSSLIYSTILGGGTTHATGLAVDPAKAIYITGPTATSLSFPLKNPIQSHGGAFLTKLSPSGSSIVYSTYLGGSNFDQPKGIKLDKNKNAYVFGETHSHDFPVKNPIQKKFGGGDTDGFWLVVNNSGSQILFSTFVGGSGPDNVDSLVIDRASGNVKIAGSTLSKNFPKSSLSTQDIREDCEDFHEELRIHKAFEVMLDRSWADLADVLFPSTNCEDLWGEIPQHRASDDVTGYPYASLNGALHAAKGGADVFVTSRDPATFVPQKQIAYGGSGNEFASAMTVDSQGRIYVAGTTSSTDLPLRNPVQGVNKGNQDGFVAIFAPNTLDLLFATYIGGNANELITAMAVDPKGNIYVTGFTESDNLPTTAHSFQRHHNGVQDDSFVVKITPGF